MVLGKQINKRVIGFVNNFTKYELKDGKCGCRFTLTIPYKYNNEKKYIFVQCSSWVNEIADQLHADDRVQIMQWFPKNSIYECNGKNITTTVMDVISLDIFPKKQSESETCDVTDDNLVEYPEKQFESETCDVTDDNFVEYPENLNE